MYQPRKPPWFSSCADCRLCLFHSTSKRNYLTRVQIPHTKSHQHLISVVESQWRQWLDISENANRNFKFTPAGISDSVERSCMHYGNLTSFIGQMHFLLPQRFICIHVYICMYVYYNDWSTRKKKKYQRNGKSMSIFLAYKPQEALVALAPWRLPSQCQGLSYERWTVPLQGGEAP